MNPGDWLTPDWPAPASVRALSTTRLGGVSAAPFDSLNLGDHVGDDAGAVATNRRLLIEALGQGEGSDVDLCASPVWLRQVHGCGVFDVKACCDPRSLPSPEADASVTRERGVPCLVMTADCLPVLFCARDGRVVGAAHAGWRGLAGGVLEATVARMAVEPNRLMAWLGPAIGPDAFEVGEDVVEAFCAADRQNRQAFRQTDATHWMADIYALARRRLAAIGLVEVYGGEFCTYSDAARFFSYRRDGRTGRMASLIWISGAG